MSSVSFDCALPYFMRQCLSEPSLLIWLTCLASSNLRSCWLCLCSTGLQVCLATPSFCVAAGDLNSASHARVASTVLSEPFSPAL